MLYHLEPFKLKHLHNAECVKYLGEGSFSNVKLYKCKEKNNNYVCDEFFVVKQLKNKKVSNEKNLRKMLLNEYTIGSLLNHENIRQTIDIDLKVYCIIFEYVPSINFLQYITHHKPSLLDKIHCFKQILNGVSYMHNIGIAHMDLKLENIMIDTIKKQVKIIDLGESKVFHDTLHITEIIPKKGIYGSIPYIAPEEFDIENEYNPEKVDVWSCGIILHEIIYNKLPWLKACTENNKYNNYINSLKSNELINKILPDKKSQRLFSMMLEPEPSIRVCINDIKIELNNTF